MLSLLFVWFLVGCIHTSTGSLRPPEVTLFSVPEDHHVCLPCGAANSSDVVWTLQGRKVLVTRQGDYQTNVDRHRYVLVSDGSLCLLHIDDSDGGGYRCNQQLVAELQVLTGRSFRVSAGRTLLLSCGRSKQKQKWFHQREGGWRREAILTRFRNGTVRREREDEGGRISFANGGLQIQDLEPEDAGEYLCNGALQARVSILTVNTETTSVQSETRTTPVSAAETDEVQEKTKKKKKKKKRSSDNAPLLVAVVGLGLTVVLTASVCVLLRGMKLRRKRRTHEAAAAAQRHEDTELQPWRTSSRQTESESPSPPEETIHYASLGRQNWRERPGRTPPDQSQDSVIYSSVITR